MALRHLKYLFMCCAVVTLLTGCSSKKSEFVSKCVTHGVGQENSCECFADLADESLSEQQFNLLIAIMSQDQAAQDKITSSFGMMGGIAASSKIAIVTGKAVASCDIAM